ncbi:MAG: PhoH family protein [Bdellovibrionota bacterium]|nr:PhoH family protein [Bdellovibrionota bacterium]
MEKIFILDTNVLLFDPRSIFSFQSNVVFIPLVVIEELDRFKKDQSENGRNARSFSRIVDKIREQGTLSSGVKLENGGTLIISVDKRTEDTQKYAFDLNHNDNLILSTALNLKDEGKNVVLVSKDINLRLKADVLGVGSEDFGTQKGNIDELYSGRKSIPVKATTLKVFEKERYIDLGEIGEEPYPNEYLTLVDELNPNHRSYGRYSKQKRGVVPLINLREGIWGIHPKNLEQKFAIDALLNDEVKLVSLVGKAGTGKTILALAAGLEMTISKEKYSRLLVSRPIQPMGNDLGFLPGDLGEKLAPWMQPIFDNMDLLFGRKKGDNSSSYDELINQGLLHVEPLTYIRGRSIPDQYMIVDEAQNLSPHEVKTIITRAGESTKIVLTGDCEQIDSPYLDSVNNGLAYCVERLKGESLISHATLVSGERSPLSEIASELL